jgi:sulfur relay (sulfurtransferase) DsrC/TusE family protein
MKKLMEFYTIPSVSNSFSEENYENQNLMVYDDSEDSTGIENHFILTKNVDVQNIIVDNSTFQKISQNLMKMMKIINGDEKISLRIVDWFVTNYAKKYYTVYNIVKKNEVCRFKVYNDYKLKLKAYAKNRFDPFCRWERIRIPYDDENFMETTIGQLNFFKWALENKIIDYIDTNYEAIESDMNARNTTSKNRHSGDHGPDDSTAKTRKKREELSISACKCIKKEEVKIVVTFN